MRRPSPKPCPTPDKAAHHNMRELDRAAHQFARKLNERGEHFDPVYGYPCGRHWHLTRKSHWDGEPQMLVLRVPDELQAWAMERVER